MTTTSAQEFIDSWLPTDYMIEAVMTGTDKRPVAQQCLPARLYESVASDQTEARTYYSSLDDEGRRSEAALVLSAGGWTVRDIAFMKS